MLKWTTPVPKEIPHEFACTGCGARRTLRQKFWQITLWCDTCLRKTIHTRQD